MGLEGGREAARMEEPRPPAAALPLPPVGSASVAGTLSEGGSDPSIPAPQLPSLPLPGVVSEFSSLGHGCRSSWTTVTLVRTMSRFDMLPKVSWPSCTRTHRDVTATWAQATCRDGTVPSDITVLSDVTEVAA